MRRWWRQRSPLGPNGCPMMRSTDPGHELWCARPRNHSDGHIYAVPARSRYQRLLWHPASLLVSLGFGMLIGVLVTLVTWALGAEMVWD